MFSWYTFDDFMIISLKVFDILVRSTIFYKIIMPLEIKLTGILSDPFLLKDTRALLLLRICL